MRTRDHTIVFLIALLAILTCLPLVHSGYTTADDIYIGLGIQEGWRSQGFVDAQRTGRFQHAVTGLLMPIAYGFGHYWLMKAFSIAAILSNVAAMFLALRLVTGSARFGLLAVVLFFAFVQNTHDHNLLTSYPFVLPLAFTLFWLAVAAWWRALEGARWMGAASTVLFAGCLLTYENFITYTIVFPAMTAAVAPGSWAERARRAVRTPHLPLLVGMLLLIVGFRVLFHSEPGREMMSAQEYTFNLDPRRIGAVLAQYGAAAMPMRYAPLYRPLVSDFYLGFGAFRVTFRDIFEVVDAAWLVKALIVAFLTAVLLLGRDSAVRRRGLVWLLVVTLLVLTNLPLAVTAKYQSWVIDSRTPGYLTVYFCVFGAVILFAMVFDGAVEWLWGRSRIAARAVAGVIVLATFALSYGTDVINAHVARSQRLIYERGKAMDAWIASPDFRALPEGSLILAPTLFEHYPGSTYVYDDYWSRYALHHGMKRLEILRPRDEWLKRAQAPDAAGRLYYLRLLQDRRGDASIIVFGPVSARAGSPLASRELSVLAHARADRFRIAGQLFGTEARCRARVFVNDRPSEATFTDHFVADIDRLRRAEEWLSTSLSSEFASFDPESIMVTPSTEALDNPIGIIYGDGFHFDEVAHRWAAARATLTLQNREARHVSVELSFEVKAPGLAPGARAGLEATSGAAHRTWEIGEAFERRSIDLDIPPLSAVDVTISTTAPALYAPLDGRSLVMMFLPQIRTVEKGCPTERRIRGVRGDARVTGARDE